MMIKLCSEWQGRKQKEKPRRKKSNEFKPEAGRVRVTVRKRSAELQQLCVK